MQRNNFAAWHNYDTSAWLNQECRSKKPISGMSLLWSQIANTVKFCNNSTHVRKNAVTSFLQIDSQTTQGA